VKKIPIGLARVRKELPPPGRIIKSKKTKRRKRAKDELREELKGSFIDK
jgi:hypothetical protein